MNSVLVLGASGMLGSTVLSWLRGCPHMDLGGTTRRRALVPVIPGDVRSFALEAGLDLSPQLTEIFDDFPADYVINCIGVINRDCRDWDRPGVVRAVQINADFPHRLAHWLARRSAHTRVLHITTDCVFSGAVGGYDEFSIADPVDFYGKSKLLGEVQSEQWLNIRCSVIGPDRVRRRSLLEWILSHPPGTVVPGYRHHHWNGVTSLQFARFCEDIIVRGQFAELRGRNHTLHYAPNLPLSKYDLVCLVDRIYGLGLRVIPADDPPPAINRVLASRFLSLPLDSIEPAIVALRDWAQDGVVRMSRAALEGRPTSVAAGPR